MYLAWLTSDRSSGGGVTFARFKIYLSYFVDYVWILVHNKVLFERFFLKKKVRIYLGLMAISYTLYFPVYLFFNSTSYDPNVGAIPTAIMSLSAIKLLGLGLYFIVKYILDRERFYKASMDAKDLEMELLKGQLNPHFLFNSLNNIYSHLVTGSANGQELILKLSELMRYILDSNKKQFVGLSEEIKFIENYIAFERERLGDRCEIIYNAQLHDGNARIAPLILFSFIENAFKHGTLSIQRSTIELSIISNEKYIELCVSNPIYTSTPTSTKIGMQNTVRRLELLYPERHELNVNNTGEKYSVNFKLMN